MQVKGRVAFANPLARKSTTTPNKAGRIARLGGKERCHPEIWVTVKLGGIGKSLKVVAGNRGSVLFSMTRRSRCNRTPIFSEGRSVVRWWDCMGAMMGYNKHTPIYEWT